MIPVTLKEIATACDGMLEHADPDAVVRSVAIDSREIVPGSLFVALAGARSHGHDFVDTAVAAGAVAALVGEDFRGVAPLVRVSDQMEALAGIGADARARLNAKVIAITGSTGKTSTREFVRAACATELRTVASERNFNNEIGVPLTVLACDERTEALVCEVGSRGVGHIAALMPIVRPDVAILTNIGGAHVGMFGSVEATALAKRELVDALDDDGVAVLNADDDRVRAIAGRTRARVVLYGRSRDAEVRADDIVLDEHAHATFTLETPEGSARVALSVIGEHMVFNALAAAAAARAVGVSLQGIAAGLEAAQAPGWRMAVRHAGAITIINDAYNAAPESMIAALKALVAMGRGRTTWAVLGPMAELGPASVAEHDRVGRMAVRLGVGRLVVVGADAKATFEAARHEGMPPQELRWFATPDEALAHIKDTLEPDAVVLVKASRAAGFEHIAEALP